VGCPFGPQPGTFLARPTHGTARLKSCPGRHGPIRVPGLGATCGSRALARPGTESRSARYRPAPHPRKPNPRIPPLAQAAALISTAQSPDSHSSRLCLAIFVLPAALPVPRRRLAASSGPPRRRLTTSDVSGAP
jgi:hypothetical protein